MKRKPSSKDNQHNKRDAGPLFFKEGWQPSADGVVPPNTQTCQINQLDIERVVKKIHSLPHLNTFRTTLRNHPTPAESFLWIHLQNSQLEGRKFRRQHSIGNYIVDFYCPSEKLAIELDGDGHYNAATEAYDAERDLFISEFSIGVLRFENKQVFDNLDSVLQQIKASFK